MYICIRKYIANIWETKGVVIKNAGFSVRMPVFEFLLYLLECGIFLLLRKIT